MKNVGSIGNIKYVQDDGSECLAKTDEEKAYVFCNYFSNVFNAENHSTFDSLPVKANLSSKPSKSFDCADIATRLKN
jgi:hypothetical protein